MNRVIVTDARTGMGTILKTKRLYRTQRSRDAAVAQLQRMNLVVETFDGAKCGGEYHWGLTAYLPMEVEA